MTVLAYLPRFRQARTAMQAMADRESWSREQIEQWQLEALNRTWRHARTEVPYYRELADRLPSTFDSLQQFTQQMPLLAKQVVRDEPHRFLSRHPAPGSWHRTGGSTGAPMRVFWQTSRHHETLRAKYRMLQTWEIDFFDRSAFLWGHSGSMAPGFAGMMMRLRRPIEDRLRNRLRLNAYRLGPHDLDRHLKSLARFAPRSLYGYSSAVAMLARQAAKRHWTCPSLQLAILTAEPADAAMLQQTSDDLQCDAAQEYGSVECGVIATSDRHGQLRVRDDHVFVETIPNQLGQFDLVVTVLGNHAFPLLRYCIEDVTSEPIARPKTQFSILKNVDGRRNDFLITSSGRTVHALAIKHVLENIDPIRRFRAHQSIHGDLQVQVELESETVLPVDAIESKLSTILEGFPVHLQTVDRIPPSLAGKHRFVISELASAHTNQGSADGTSS